MKRIIKIASVLGIMCIFPGTATYASPAKDLNDIRAYFQERFPNVPFQEYGNGIYALDEGRRAAWQEFEDFAPAYEDALAMGKEMFNQPFKNGKTYASCFKNGGISIRQNYPYFDQKTGRVKTLEAEINECRTKNGEKPLGYGKDNLAAISAYMASTSKGKPLNVKVPDDPRAIAIYETGKRHFYSKRGQLNFSCADCHLYGSGNTIRGDLLSPALGHVTHFPVWRTAWAAGKSGPLVGLGTIQRRYTGCNSQVRAKPFKPQDDEYTALEYFHTHMSNGLHVNAPSIRQ